MNLHPSEFVEDSPTERRKPPDQLGGVILHPDVQKPTLPSTGSDGPVCSKEQQVYICYYVPLIKAANFDRDGNPTRVIERRGNQKAVAPSGHG